MISAAVLAVFGLVSLFWLIPGYVATSAATDDLSPAFMPYVAAALATGAAALLLVSTILRGRAAPAAAEVEASPLLSGSWLFIGTTVAILTVTFVLIDVFGYLPGAAVMVAGFMLLVRARWPIVIGTAIVFPLALWLLFDRLLEFPLP